MKKAICLIIVLVLCLSLIVPAFAAESFTPSVQVPDAPVVVPPTDNTGRPVVKPSTDDKKDEEDKEVDEDAPVIKPAEDEEGNVVENATGETAIAVMDIKIVGDTVLESGKEEVDYIFEDCLLITSVAQAQKPKDQLEGADKEAHDELLEVYEKLRTGEMEIPYEEFGLDPETMEILELFDGSWLCEGKVVSEDVLHPHKLDHAELLGNDPENPEDGNVLHITFELNVGPDEVVHVFTYKHHDFDPEGEKSWGEIVDVVNNGDGTVTCTFEHLCPIAICIETE